ncbi:hypothetical protein [Spongiactinospora rosea]|uniref:hypothetical protein n=1 Tax=Spongiactinospora rosea TaxID=2248750 RepID=UPI0011C03E60|nr:hypothetical protein [Spongiactinospora rosea]
MRRISINRAFFVALTTIVTGTAVFLGISGPVYARPAASNVRSGASPTAVGDPQLFYRATDGQGSTGVVDAAGNFTNLKSIPGFATGWTHITLC